MTTALSTIKAWFGSGKKPLGDQFSAAFDSFLHKSGQVPKSMVGNPREDVGLFLFTLKQSGTERPEIRVLYSDFTYDPVWTTYYEDRGSYIIYIAEEYTNWAEGAFFSTSQPDRDDIKILVKKSGTYSIRITTESNGNLSDDILDDSVLFEARVMPEYY